MIDKSKVAILSTVINFELYKKSSLTFPADIKKYVIDGRNKMYGVESLCYMVPKLKGLGIHWLVMADEDVLFLNPEGIYPILERMEQQGALFSGVREGGVIKHRTFNPHVINTFFSILNFKEIEKIWDKAEMLKNQFTVENEFADDLTNVIYDYDKRSLYEPYYCFYLWLRRKSNKVLFLGSKSLPDDDIANAVLDLNDDIMLYHTWYSRLYGISEKHTVRIDKILNSIPIQNTKVVNPVIFKDNTFALKKKLKRVVRKLKSILGELKS